MGEEINNKPWNHPQQEDAINKIGQENERKLFFGTDNSEPVKEDPRKWAMLEIDGQNQLQWMDEVTGKAYYRDGYEPTWTEIKDFKFIRWGRGMDV